MKNKDNNSKKNESLFSNQILIDQLSTAADPETGPPGLIPCLHHPYLIIYVVFYFCIIKRNI